MYVLSKRELDVKAPNSSRAVNHNDLFKALEFVDELFASRNARHDKARNEEEQQISSPPLHESIGAAGHTNHSL